VASASLSTTTREVGPAREAFQARPKGGIHLVAVALATSLSVLLTEVAYTRVVSFKLYYYYVYLVIGLALLGLGVGSIMVALSVRIRTARIEAVLGWSLTAGAASTVLSYLAVSRIRIDTLALWEYATSSWIENLVLLLATCLCLFSCFVGPGVVLATIFSRRSELAGRLYASDLVGAAVASAGSVYAIWYLGAPGAVMLAASILAASGAVVAWRDRVAWREGRPVALVGGLLAVCSVALVAFPGTLPQQAVDSSKYFIKPSQIDLASGWGPIFRVDVAQAPHHPSVLNLYHDGILGASILRWNGRVRSLSSDDFALDPRSIPFSVLGKSPAHEAVIGAAGGHEVLVSLYYGARHVDAVELNPVTVDFVSSTFAGFDGHLAQNRAVRYVTGDGRSFLARTSRRFQLIWYPAPDSYAATNSALASAYVLSESYLYTINALATDLQHLTRHGLFVAQFGEDDNVHDLRTTRFVATARSALAELGVADPSSHLMVAITETKFLGIPLSTILVSRSSFTSRQVHALLEAVERVPGTKVLAAPGIHVSANPVNTVARLPEADLASFYSRFPFNVTPTSDNDPYFWHFARFGSVLEHFASPLSSVNREDAVGERVLVLLLGLAVVMAAAFLLVPFLVAPRVRRRWLDLERKGASLVFFASIGVGFMFFEMTLMQMLNLFLGYPTYAVVVTLAVLLASTGVGALASRNIGDVRPIPLMLLGSIMGLCAFYLWGMPSLVSAALGLPFVARVLITVVMLAPAGLCFGAFMPMGLQRVACLAPTGEESLYVAWGWAVNGFASVVAAVAATVLSMDMGFRIVLAAGAVLYAVATGAWLVLRRV
jgi:hypothetical protein